MAIKKITTPVKKITKKTISKEVQTKIAAALTGYKSAFDPEDFESKLKKAGKLFAGDILKKNKINDKKTPVKKKAAVKK
jgi:hypothetical protein